MWVFTSTGFLSAVESADDPNLLSIRARDRVSLHPLVAYVKALPGNKKPRIVVGAGTDYPFRVTVSREAFALFMFDTVNQMIDYTNFKDEAKHVRGKKWSDTLMTVWAVAHRLTDREGQQHSPYYEHMGMLWDD